MPYDQLVNNMHYVQLLIGSQTSSYVQTFSQNALELQGEKRIHILKQKSNFRCLSPI